MQTTTSSQRDSANVGLFVDMHSSLANEAMKRLKQAEEESKEDVNPFDQCLDFEEYSPEE